MAVIAFHGKDKRFTEPCLRFARALQLDFFPLLVQPATGERYASPIPSYQHFSAMGSDPIETREMKGTLEARPVFVNTPGHIRAHLLVCFIALTMIRLIQRRVVAAETKRDDGGDLKWSYGMSGARLSAALRDWQVCELPQECYMMQNASGEDICRILSAFGIDNADRIYTKGGLAALKSGVEAF